MVNGYEGGRRFMVNAYVGLKQIAMGFEHDRDFLALIAAYYASEYYGYYLDGDSDELHEFYEYVDNSDDDLAVNIQNTLANVDRGFGEEEEEEEEDCEEDECEDCGVCEMTDETRALMERNRRLNEQALGL